MPATSGGIRRVMLEASYLELGVQARTVIPRSGVVRVVAEGLVLRGTGVPAKPVALVWLLGGSATGGNEHEGKPRQDRQNRLEQDQGLHLPNKPCHKVSFH